MGDWVMLEALQHTEAGALHAVGGRTEQTRLGSYPWKITLSQAPEVMEGCAVREEPDREVTAETRCRLQKALSWHYDHLAATQAPSKQTATDRKGRQKDEEAAENSPAPKQTVRTWRQPSFLRQQPTAVGYGNAIHRAMQYIRYENCGSEEDVRQEIDHLTKQGFLGMEEAEIVNCKVIATFFRSEIGIKLREGATCLREFKFSILDDGNHYGDGLEGEKVLLQGVVDCALLEEDGITVIDFKTDAVTEDTLSEAVERYRPQVQTYSEALSRIYGMEIKAQYLYFFRLNRFVEV
jgi:ATP-dependent helicase/nuclease subunit A